MDTCSERMVHPDRLAAAQADLAAAPVAALAETFRVLGDPTRVGILLALVGRELCGCDLAELFAVSPSAISHQLRLLRAHRLVRSRREGKMVYYRLDDAHVSTLFAVGVEHLQERPG